MDFRNTSGLPLGLRNNNPGNIRPGDDWKGMIGTNSGFVVFSDIVFGIRAMATDIIGDIVVDGKNTITKLISEYAPPSENDTQSYIDTVAHWTGWNKDETIDPTLDNIAVLLRAMMNVELGKKYADMVNDSDILEGIKKVNSKLTDRIKNFFASNPAIAAVAGVSIFAALVILAIVFFPKLKKFING